MFEMLTAAERCELVTKLRHGARELLTEGCVLAEARQLRPTVLDSYQLPRDGADGFFHASTDASVLAVEVLNGTRIGPWA